MTEYLDLEDRPGLARAQELSAYLLRLFNEGTVGEVNIIYNEFVNAMLHRSRFYTLLPMEGRRIEEFVKVEKEREEEEDLFYRYEPEPEIVLDALLPRFFSSLVYAAFLEAKASEFSSRMTAMKTATENSKEMISKLTLEYNKARQAAITQEILEIVNTSEALSSG